MLVAFDTIWGSRVIFLTLSMSLQCIRLVSSAEDVHVGLLPSTSGRFIEPILSINFGDPTLSRSAWELHVQGQATSQRACHNRSMPKLEVPEALTPDFVL